MTARVLTGSKQEIAEKVTRIEGEVREVIVFVEDPRTASGPAADIFAEMDALTVRQAVVDDSREAIYRRAEGE